MILEYLPLHSLKQYNKHFIAGFIAVSAVYWLLTSGWDWFE